MLAAGTELGKYKVLRLLGRGGMADVYEAEDARLGRRVALKVLPPEFGRDDNAVARFQKEVRAAAVLNHAGIVTVYDVAQEQGLHFYAMRLLGGGDLRQRIEHGLKPEQALGVIHQLAGAFAHAHAAGFVHRDVKPENILFDEQGRAVLTDFGIAKAISSSAKMTATGVSIGTPRYISPEQARGKPVDARADLYSLGVILYEMLTGKLPFEAEDSLALIFKHVTEPVPRLPPELARYQPLIDTLMAKEPDGRPASAEDLQAMVQPLLPAERSLRLPAIKPAAIPPDPRVVTGERAFAKQLAEEEERQKRLEAQRREQTAAAERPAAQPPPPAAAAPTAPATRPPPPPPARPARAEVLARATQQTGPGPGLAIAAVAVLLLFAIVVWRLLPDDDSAAAAPAGAGSDSPAVAIEADDPSTALALAEPPPADEPLPAAEDTPLPEDVAIAAEAAQQAAEEEARRLAEQQAAERRAAERRRQEQERRRREAAAAATATPAPTADPSMNKAQRMAWERARCDRHVSALFPGWEFTYADIASYPGITRRQNGYIETPPLATDYGAMQRYIVDPTGCIVGTR